jgi:hypothetical protein
LTAVVVTLLVVALAGAGVVATRSGLVSAVSSRLPWASTTPCTSTEVTVVAVPAAVPVIEQILRPLDRRTLPDGSCLDVGVQGELPARSVEGDGLASARTPQVWVPDSSLWAGQMERWNVQPVGSLGTSPVVLAGHPATIRRLGWSDRAPSWPEALTPERRLVAPAMTDDASSLLALLALARSIGPGEKAEQAVVGLVLAAARTPAADVDAAAVLARSKSLSAPVMLTSKHVVTQLNFDPSRDKLAAVAPQGLPAVLDYPVLRVSESGEDPVVAAGADLVAAALTAPDALPLTRAAGFDAPSRTVAPTTPQGRAAAKAALAQVSAFVAQVRQQAVPSRLLILMDVSGSMGLRVRPGLSRGRLASTAALSAGRLLPDDSTIGLWKFAGAQREGRAYTEVAPIDELGAIEGGQTHREIVNSAIAALPRQLSSGGTALYEATLAAVRTMRESYDPAARNAVVVFTDGANEFPGGITLREFQQAVQADAKANPDRPIVLVLIGIGPSADMRSLQAMAAPVGGRAYKADSPGALRIVLFDAIASRSRPKS